MTARNVWTRLCQFSSFQLSSSLQTIFRFRFVTLQGASPPPLFARLLALARDGQCRGFPEASGRRRNLHHARASCCGRRTPATRRHARCRTDDASQGPGPLGRAPACTAMSNSAMMTTPRKARTPGGYAEMHRAALRASASPPQPVGTPPTSDMGRPKPPPLAGFEQSTFSSILAAVDADEARRHCPTPSAVMAAAAAAEVVSSTLGDAHHTRPKLKHGHPGGDLGQRPDRKVCPCPPACVCRC